MATATKTAGKRATYEDLVAIPADKVAEILDGELVVSPRRSLPHAKAGSTAGGELATLFDRKPGGPGGPGGWWILDEPELHLRQDVVVPDIAGWRRERMPRIPITASSDIAPDWGL